MRARRERVVYASLKPMEMFMHACLMPKEAARFRVQKCVNNHQLIVAGVERFFTTRIHNPFPYYLDLQNAACPTCSRVYTQTVIGTFLVHGNGNMHACLTQ